MKLMRIFPLVFLYGCVCTSQIDTKLSQDFISDLGSENNRMAGDLYLDYLNQDLSKLSYSYYLTFITKNEAPSAKGFSMIVKIADYHFFQSFKKSFVVALYYKNERTIICDNSNTIFCDSVHTYGVRDTIPELLVFASKILNRGQ